MSSDAAACVPSLCCSPGPTRVNQGPDSRHEARGSRLGDHPTPSTPGRHVVTPLALPRSYFEFCTACTVRLPRYGRDKIAHTRDRYVLATRTPDRCNGTSHLQALQIHPVQAFAKTEDAHITSQPGLGSNKAGKSAADPPHPSFGLDGLRGTQTPLCPRQKPSRRLVTPQPARLCSPVTCYCCPAPHPLDRPHTPSCS